MTDVLLGPLAKPSRSDVAKARLLDAGLKLFGERNVDGVSIRDLAAAAGQNPAAISYHFGGKEGLYRAVLEAMMRIRDSYTRPLVEEIRQLRKSRELTEEEAAGYLKRLLRTFFCCVRETKNAPSFAALIIREQTHPTPVFDSIYRSGIEPLHRLMTELVATMTGEDPAAPRTILRAHALLGQLHAFLMSRETILRRVGWSDFEGKHADLIPEVLDENIDIFLAGLRVRQAPAQSRDPANKR